jgi:hypothetical protein
MMLLDELVSATRAREDALIQMKTLAVRPQDLADIERLQAIDR